MGTGADILVVFQGLSFDNAPMSGFEARFTLPVYSFLSADYTVFVVNRKKHLPAGSTIRDMGDDYAEMIEQEFVGPVDVIGLSTGGSICQEFAADHPDLVRKLVIHSSAYKLGPVGREVQLRTQDFAREGKWRQVVATMMEFVLPPAWYRRPAIFFGSAFIKLAAPDDPSDMIVTIEAEDQFDFHDRLGEISAPTLLVAGANDPGYTPELFRDTAAGIPDCKLALYPGMGHPAKGPRSERDVLAFLRACDT